VQRRRGGGQLDGEHRVAGAALHAHVPAVLLDDSVRHAQAEASPLTHLLRGEERLEDPRQGIARNAGTVVGHGDHDPGLALVHTDPGGHANGIAHALAADAAAEDGLLGIQDQVEEHLLKLMEETEVPTRSPQDIAGQVQALMDFSQRGKKSPSVINTKHILFVVSGAFVGLDKLVGRRLNQATIGFVSRTGPSTPEQLLDQASTKDFVEFGLEPEFIGRLPVVAVLEDLSKDALVQILSKPKNAIIKQYQKLFEFENVRLKFSDDALEAIAQLAMERKVGARGLRMILEDLMLDLMYYLPTYKKVREFAVTKEMVLTQKINVTLLEKAG
jgi:hypothetical protein